VAGRAPARATPPAIVGEQLTQMAAGLASLDVALAERGRIYRFITPRGDIEIRARSIPVVALSRLAGLAAVLVAIFVVWLFGREPSRQLWSRLSGSTACRISLIIVGLASVLLGILPVAGVVLILTALVLIARSRFAKASRRVANM